MAGVNGLGDHHVASTDGVSGQSIASPAARPVPHHVEKRPAGSDPIYGFRGLCMHEDSLCDPYVTTYAYRTDWSVMVPEAPRKSDARQIVPVWVELAFFALLLGMLLSQLDTNIVVAPLGSGSTTSKSQPPSGSTGSRATDRTVQRAVSLPNTTGPPTKPER